MLGVLALPRLCCWYLILLVMSVGGSVCGNNHGGGTAAGDTGSAGCSVSRTPGSGMCLLVVIYISDGGSGICLTRYLC